MAEIWTAVAVIRRIPASAAGAAMAYSEAAAASAEDAQAAVESVSPSTADDVTYITT